MLLFVLNVYPELSSMYMQGKVSFAEVTGGVSKRVAAAAFLEVLQLKTWGRISATQRSPFEDIVLAPSHSTITGAI